MAHLVREAHSHNISFFPVCLVDSIILSLTAVFTEHLSGDMTILKEENLPKHDLGEYNSKGRNIIAFGCKSVV